jgi:rRNA maturation endonuclease Nob1
MGKPTLEEFRRWLQSEIQEIEALESGPNVQKRLTQLEMALQEAMAFSAAWDLRTDASIVPVIKEKSVRLLSESPDISNTTEVPKAVCSHCDAEIDEDLPFCPACGENR